MFSKNLNGFQSFCIGFIKPVIRVNSLFIFLYNFHFYFCFEKIKSIQVNLYYFLFENNKYKSSVEINLFQFLAFIPLINLLSPLQNLAFICSVSAINSVSSISTSFAKCSAFLNISFGINPTWIQRILLEKIDIILSNSLSD